MRLEEKLAKWAERPEDEDEDGDYGLIIDDTVTAARPTPFPPKFTKAGSCSLLPTRPALLSPPMLMAANIRPLGRPADAGMPQRHAARLPLSARDVLQRFTEPASSDNYDDMVLPEDEEMLDRQLAEWRTPCRRTPSWPNGLADEVTMSGATAVETEAPRTKPAAAAAHAASSPKESPTSGPAASRRHAPQPPIPADARSLALAAMGPRSPLCRAEPRGPRQPMLITSAQQPTEPVVLGRMRYDPARRMWLGNEEEGVRIAGAIADSEHELYARSAGRAEHPIDTSKLAHKVSQRSGCLGLSPVNPDDMDIDSVGHCTSPGAGSPQFLIHAAAAAATTTTTAAAVAAANGRRRLSPTNPLTQGSIEAAKGRPALIPPSAASLVDPAAGVVVGGRARPIFDPQNLRWIDPNENQLDSPADPFRDIADLPVEPSSVDAVHCKSRARSASDALGGDATKSCFALTDEQIAAYHRESVDYDSFAQHWFPKSSI
ncbi:hypothetical protein LPJ61_003058 [Coemansia biformis]|uniref:Uncharacterized protein n=1 Tax=Coemansia biformis TaxID=1286918 RepID=A0A9W7YCV3_9FUNG|nr:hypothetical protein LPJ61_003058 [Coemansia biformis]